MLDKETAFSQLQQRTYRTIFRYARERVQTRAETEELVNGAYLRLWEEWNIFARKSENEKKRCLYRAIEYGIFERIRQHPAEMAGDWMAAAEEAWEDEEGGEEPIEEPEDWQEVRPLLEPEEWKLFQTIVDGRVLYAQYIQLHPGEADTISARISHIREKLKDIL